MPDKHGPCYVFDEFTLDLRRACLLRAGERVSLRPKAFDALRYLVEHRGELASKDALVRALWPRSVVTDDSLVKCIQEIREALGDKQHRYVKTVPRRGYLFDVPVEVRASEPSGEAGSSGESAPVGSAGPAAGDSGEAARRRVGRGRFGWPVAVAAAAVVLAVSAAYYFLAGGSRLAQASPSIAVLPFLNLSSESEQEYFSDGLAEELLSRLARLEGLRVAAQTSSFTFKGSNADIRTIAAKLGVANVLEGSVRKAGDEIRITVQLIEAKGGTHLWSQTYERRLDDIFAIQEEIAEAVATALSITLGVNDREKLRSGTRNVDAFNHYLAGLASMNAFGRTSTASGIAQLEQATAIDPEYADAWSLRSLAEFQYAYIVTGDFATAQEHAEQAARRALELNPNMAGAHAALANVHMIRREWARAEREVAMAVAIPSDATATWDYAELLETTGYLEETLEYRRRTRRALPLNIAPAVDLALAYHALGDDDSAETEVMEASELVGDHVVLYAARSRLAMARHDEDTMRRMLAGRTDADGPVVTTLISILDSPDTAGGALHRLHEMFRDDPVTQHFLSLWAAYFGEPELAIELMRPRALSGPLFAQPIWDPLMRDARSTQAFKDFVRELGLVDFWRTRGPPTLCHFVGTDDFECD